MKRLYLLSVLVLAALIVSCGGRKDESSAKKKIIFETDLGNDVDDVLALDMIYKYIESNDIELLAVMINKNGTTSAELLDILNTWYGHTGIPVGVVRDGADCENDAVNYAKAVCDLTDADGKPLFERSAGGYESLPDAHVLYREVLAKQPDNSVTVVSVGFSTNLARLLETPADNVSHMTGRELVAAKVNLLCSMAGCIDDPELNEYNIVRDIPAAKLVFGQWPTPIVVSPFEVGIDITYPASSIENDFDWTARHPMVEAYKSYLPMPYDRPTWDLTALLYAVEGDGYFGISETGRLTVSDSGSTAFTADPTGNVRYLFTDNVQNKAILDRFVTLITEVPLKYR